MKTALLLYWHGLGDLICLTPQLRELHRRGYVVDLICRHPAIESQLFVSCPYIRQTISLPYKIGGPAEGGSSGAKKAQQCFAMFQKLSSNYNIAMEFSERPQHIRGGKVARNSKVCGFTSLTNLDLEVFISDKAEVTARRYIDTHYPDGYIFCHTMIEWHQCHNWNAKNWISEHLNDLPIVDTGVNQTHEMLFDDISIAFVLAREATHRVLSSSVFVHACDAMNVVIDVVHYGRESRHAWPIVPGKIKVVHGVK